MGRGQGIFRKWHEQSLSSVLFLVLAAAICAAAHATHLQQTGTADKLGEGIPSACTMSHRTISTRLHSYLRACGTKMVRWGWDDCVLQL